MAMRCSESPPPVSGTCNTCGVFFENLESHTWMRSQCKVGCEDEVQYCDYVRHILAKHPVLKKCFNCDEGVRYIALDHLAHTVSDDNTHCGYPGCDAKPFRSYTQCIQHLREVHKMTDLYDTRDEQGTTFLHDTLMKVRAIEKNLVSTSATTRGAE